MFAKLLSLFCCGSVFISLSSCSLLSTAPAKVYFHLSDVACSTNLSDKLLPAITISNKTISPIFNGQRLVFAADKNQRAFYQDAYWIEAPSKRITLLTRDYLECSTKNSGVSSNDSALNSKYNLQIELQELTHYTLSVPGSAVIKLRLELIDLDKNHMIASKTIQSSVDLNQYNALGFVEAVNRQVPDLLHQIASFVINSTNTLP